MTQPLTGTMMHVRSTFQVRLLACGAAIAVLLLHGILTDKNMCVAVQSQALTHLLFQATFTSSWLPV